MRATPLLLVVALVVDACARQPVRVHTEPATGAMFVETGVLLGYAPKRVLAKSPPETLIAADGTVCRVAAERFRRTEPGRVAACAWQLAPTPADP